VILANRYLLGGVAATGFALSTLLAGLHAAAAGRGGAVVHAAGGPRSALAASSLAAGISSEQSAVDDIQRMAAAAQAAELQRQEMVAAGLGAANGRRPQGEPSATGPGQRALSTAEAQRGKPYQYAGAGPSSFDCSGLTMFAWRAAGVSLPHSATDQYRSTTHVALSDLQPGDLMYFGSGGSIAHVAMYVSPGWMIEAEETGTVVSINPIRSGLVGASRP
jgi:cell wall-associated NlpC family hydrolase